MPQSAKCIGLGPAEREARERSVRSSAQVQVPAYLQCTGLHIYATSAGLPSPGRKIEDKPTVSNHTI